MCRAPTLFQPLALAAVRTSPPRRSPIRAQVVEGVKVADPGSGRKWSWLSTLLEMRTETIVLEMEAVAARGAPCQWQNWGGSIEGSSRNPRVGCIWGKWGRKFRRIWGSSRGRLKYPVSPGPISSMSPAATPSARGYPGFVAAPRSPGAGVDRRAGVSSLLWLLRPGTPVRSRRGAHALLAVPVRVALSGRRRYHAKGFSRPQQGRGGDDPDWLRFRVLGSTTHLFRALCPPPVLSALWCDQRGRFAGEVKKPGPAHQPLPRYRKE